MKKVLIVSISRDEEKSLAEAAANANQRDLSFDTTSSFGQEVVWWTTMGPDLLVLSLPPDDLMQGYFLTKLREDVPKGLPLVILCSVVSSSLMTLSQLFTRVRIVKLPATGESILKAVTELTAVYGANQRQGHPRYLTEQEVFISSELQGLRNRALMKNLSLSGIYFEIFQAQAVYQTTDIVKITVQIGRPAKDYSFDAKIVWSRPLDSRQGWGFGASFINKEEVYNNLLKGF